jgi:hypothetical protein
MAAHMALMRAVVIGNLEMIGNLEIMSFFPAARPPMTAAPVLARTSKLFHPATNIRIVQCGAACAPSDRCLRVETVSQFPGISKCSPPRWIFNAAASCSAAPFRLRPGREEAKSCRVGKGAQRRAHARAERRIQTTPKCERPCRLTLAECRRGFTWARRFAPLLTLRSCAIVDA